MITTQPLFSTDFGKITDFSGKRAADIFNEAVIPRVNSFLDLLGDDPGGLQEASERREAELSTRRAQDLFSQEKGDAFLNSLIQGSPQPMDLGEHAPEPAGDYDAPAVSSDNASIKLSNYGYASDSSPDYNSNVKRIGHANNPLVDGYSAALTKSLAKKHGLKTGDEFEVTLADGKRLVRRYDDTVPTKYKGKALPETVDLYELGGSNKFGGVVVGIKPLKS